jgi:hypothetical protein
LTPLSFGHVFTLSPDSDSTENKAGSLFQKLYQFEMKVDFVTTEESSHVIV